MPSLSSPPPRLVQKKLITDTLKQKADYAILSSYCLRLETLLKNESPQSLLALRQGFCFNRLDVCDKALSEILSSLEPDDQMARHEKELLDVLLTSFDDRFRFDSSKTSNPPATIESVLGIVALNGYTQLVAPLVNLSKRTRNCIVLQPAMREVKNERGETQLHYFSRMGLTSSVERMLSMKGIDVESRFGRPGWTCLMSSAMNGHTDICRLLLQRGANVKAVHKHNGTTPLHLAAQSGAVDVVKLLADFGADLEARDYSGCRALHWAAISGHLDVVVELIVERRVYINARHNEGDTPLTFARLHKHHEIAKFITSFQYCKEPDGLVDGLVSSNKRPSPPVERKLFV